jgi:hypothetical protein
VKPGRRLYAPELHGKIVALIRIALIRCGILFRAMAGIRWVAVPGNRS